MGLLLRKKGKDFEIVIDADKAVEFKAGKIEISEVLKSENIFSDAKKCAKDARIILYQSN